MMCILCEKKTDNFVVLENDFVCCRTCYDKIYPYLVRDYVLGFGCLVHRKSI